VFEKVVLRRSQNGLGLSLGEVAEALLFYQNVHLVLDMQSLSDLSRSLGTSELLALVERGRLSAVYAEDFLAAHNQLVGTVQRHGFIAGFISGRVNEDKILKSRRERLEYRLELDHHARGDARRLAERFLKRIPIVRYASDAFVTGGIPTSATNDLTDGNYVTAAIRRILRDQIGFQPFAENLRLEVIKLSAGEFSIRHNIDFATGNARRKQIDPTLENLTEGNILVALLDASADLNIASRYGGDFYTSATNSDIVRIRYEETLKRTDISSAQLQQFRELLLPEFPRIRDVINSGERTFAEFETLLDQSPNFRSTVHKISPDANLVSEYLQAVRKQGWLSSIGGKPVRFIVGLAVDAPNPVAGKNWTTADDLLLGNLKSWRPSHFVDDKLKPFLRSREDN
jgi:hypothetical protein